MSIVTVNKEAIAKIRAAFDAKQLFRQNTISGPATYGGPNPCAIGVMMTEEVRVKADTGSYGGYQISEIVKQFDSEELGSFFDYQGRDDGSGELNRRLSALQRTHDSGRSEWETDFNQQLKELEEIFA